MAHEIDLLSLEFQPLHSPFRPAHRAVGGTPHVSFTPEGLAAMGRLPKAGGKVLWRAADEMLSAPGADDVALYLINGKLNGRGARVVASTFNEGIRDLIEAGFLAARSPGRFWINGGLMRVTCE